jgi:hypothetical protein
LFHARQFLRQTLSARVGFALALGDRLAPRFGFDFFARHPGLFLQQLQLQIAQRFATRPVLPDALLPQLFLQRLDFQVRPLQLVFEIRYAEL